MTLASQAALPQNQPSKSFSREGPAELRQMKDVAETRLDITENKAASEWSTMDWTDTIMLLLYFNPN